MAEEEQNSNPVFSTHVTGPGENPATPAATSPTRSKKPWILAAGILVLVVLIIVLLVSGIVDTSPDPVIGTWTAGSGSLQVQCTADGTAVIRYADAGTPVQGKWEKVAEGRYQLVSATGTKSPVLIYDPMADALRTTDYSLILARKG